VAHLGLDLAQRRDRRGGPDALRADDRVIEAAGHDQSDDPGDVDVVEVVGQRPVIERRDHERQLDQDADDVDRQCGDVEASVAAAVLLEEVADL
jgi:hypothetical protein